MRGTYLIHADRDAALADTLALRLRHEFDVEVVLYCASPHDPGTMGPDLSLARCVILLCSAESVVCDWFRLEFARAVERRSDSLILPVAIDSVGDEWLTDPLHLENRPAGAIRGLGVLRFERFHDEPPSPDEYAPILARRLADVLQPLRPIPAAAAPTSPSKPAGVAPDTPPSPNVFDRHAIGHTVDMYSSTANTVRDAHIGEPLDPVEMTLYSPTRVRRNQRFFIQAIFHTSAQRKRARKMATLTDSSATKSQVLPLSASLLDRQYVRVTLEGDPGVEIDEPQQGFTWLGDLVARQFVVKLPSDNAIDTYFFTATVDVGGMPVGRCKFSLKIGGAIANTLARRGEYPISRYEFAFLSYASEDVSTVLDIAQLLEVQGLAYFLDRLSLRAGVEWPRELERQIQRSDLFIVCWSRHAAASEWVTREIQMAMSFRERSEGARPDIRPFILEGPPIPPPPEGLKGLNFDSPTLLAKAVLAKATGTTPNP